MNTPPNLSVWVTDAPRTNVSLQFFVRPMIPRPDFTVVVLPDTQFYTGGDYNGTPAMFATQVEWIVTNRPNRNIACVLHTGDVVNRGDTTVAEWQAAADAMYRLEDPATTGLEHGIPYGIAVGNHDGAGAGPFGYDAFHYYNQFFGVPRFQGRPYYGGHYGTNNNSHYLLFSASDMDFIVLHLQYAAGTNTALMNWANSVLQAHSIRRAIVVSHSLLHHGPDYNNLPFSPEGTPIYEALKGNANIFLMLCGHDPQAGKRQLTNNGSIVTLLLADYESLPHGGEGWLRTLEFSPSNHVIRVQTYSPTLNQFKTAEVHQFTLDQDLRGFTLINTISNVPPGLITTETLTHLPPARDFEWFVEANTGGVTSRSAVWKFNLAAAPTPPTVRPLEVFTLLRNQQGHILIGWRSVGSRRYRVEYNDGDARGGFTNQFKEIVRSPAEETDPAPAGAAGVRFFTDDFTYTGGPPPKEARYFRIREVH